jgi:hypothetical protein
MIKHWRLFDTITAEQIKQLDTAGICVKIENDVSELEFPLAGKVQFVKSSDVYISTINEKQESFLFLMFNTDKLDHVGTEYDDKHTWWQA